MLWNRWDNPCRNESKDSSFSRYVDRMVTQEAAERLLDTPRLRSDMTHLSKALGRWILHTNRLDITHQTHFNSPKTREKREKGF